MYFDYVFRLNYKRQLLDCKRQLLDCKRQLLDCKRQLLIKNALEYGT